MLAGWNRVKTVLIPHQHRKLLYQVQISRGVAKCYALDFWRFMKKRCTPQMVRKMHQQTGSWRSTASILNHQYGVNLPHLTWRDYATRRRDISDAVVRTALLLGPRPCPTCKSNPHTYFTRLLKNLRPADLRKWTDLRDRGNHREARQLLDAVFSRKSHRSVKE